MVEFSKNLKHEDFVLSTGQNNFQKGGLFRKEKETNHHSSMRKHSSDGPPNQQPTGKKIEPVPQVASVYIIYIYVYMDPSPRSYHKVSTGSQD